jgi:hypothetical protein
MKLHLKAMVAMLSLVTATPAMAGQVTGTGAAANTTSQVRTVTSTATVAQTGSITKVVVKINGHSDYSYYGSDNSYAIRHNGKVVKIYTTQCAAKYNANMSAQDYDAYQDANDLYYSLPMCPQSVYGVTTFRPEEPLSGFNGMDASGTWDLILTAGKDTAEFKSWSVEITYDTPVWTTSAWSAWSSTCGSATHTRTVTCSYQGVTSPDSACFGTKPVSTETQYQTSGCTYFWQSTAWTNVYSPNYTCGAKTQTRTTACRRTDNTAATDAACIDSGLPKPATTQAYDDPNKCSFQWSVGTWSTSTQTCGNGTRTRTVRCLDANKGTTATTEGMCTDTTMGGQGPKPATSEQTDTYTSCQYGWYRSGFSLGSCINGRQTYRAYYTCFRSTGVPVTQFCGDKPPSRVITQSCPYWETNINQTWNDTAPGYNLTQSQYSTSGVSNGSGYMSKGADGVSGSTGYGNAGVPAGGSSTTLPQRTGGTYDVDTDIYTVSPSARYTGGNYSTATGTYDGGTLMDAQPDPTPTPTSGADPSDTGRNIVMRRPIPGAGR